MPHQVSEAPMAHRPCLGADALLGVGRLGRKAETGTLQGVVKDGSRNSSCKQPACRYLMSVSILNIGMYIEMRITPTMPPTAIIISGSMIEVRAATAASTSSS